jgi:DNA repair protein RecO (recombination protein O)
MQWNDEGIVLAVRRQGERSLIVELLTREHGRHAGLVRGGQAPRARAPWQIGNRLLISWKARLAEHLGQLTGELAEGAAARLLDDRVRLAALAAAAALAASALPEREPHPQAYAGLLSLIAALAADDGWAVAYVTWEIELLQELGFGLDLTRCAATGQSNDLIYVSPKSGQAVSRQAGAPYRGKLLALPSFLLAQGQGRRPAAAEVLAGLDLAGYFLEARVFLPHGRKLPAARSRYVDVLRQVLTISGST